MNLPAPDYLLQDLTRDNDVESKPNEILQWIEHLWPWVAGIALTIWAAIKLMWANFKKDLVTKEELHRCKTTVLQHDDDQEEKVLKEIKELRKDFHEESRANAKQHQDILSQVLRLHSGD